MCPVARTLLVRERSLAQRRNTVEEWLQWLDEEKTIEELETKIKTLAIQTPGTRIREDEEQEERIYSDYIPQHEEPQVQTKEEISVIVIDGDHRENSARDDSLVLIIVEDDGKSADELEGATGGSQLKNATLKRKRFEDFRAENAVQVQSSKQSELLSEEQKSSILTEAEELHRKQLAIEQEIKLLKEQQQAAARLFFLREIPDKPPPPYTPPSRCKTKPQSVIPKTKEECEQIVEYCVKIIHKAYLCGNLDNITISEKTLSLIVKDKSCCKFIFDLCKEVANNHYGQFKQTGPSWLKPQRKLSTPRPLDVVGLNKLMQERVLTQLGFKRKPKVENSILKWSRKNWDQVDEVLVHDMQLGEASLTNTELDSALVKDKMVDKLMEMVIQDTITVFRKTMAKKLEKQHS